MAIQLYVDVHVPQSITVQLRRRNVNVLTAQEEVRQLSHFSKARATAQSEQNESNQLSKWNA
jgi:hypothetical protein